MESSGNNSMSEGKNTRRVLLSEVAQDLERVLVGGAPEPPLFSRSDIRCETNLVSMRDGVRLATDVYLPPQTPSPTIAIRTPYGRAKDKLVVELLAFARCGYVVVAQDCRGTGESEPEKWDFYVYESEDSFDFVQWIATREWFDGFIGACGGSYVGQTQWCMAAHPSMSAIAPEVSGLGVAINTAHLHMFINSYARSVVEKTRQHHSHFERLMLDETLAGGRFNEPLYPQPSSPLLTMLPELGFQGQTTLRGQLWKRYCESSCSQRAEMIRAIRGTDSVGITDTESVSAYFGHGISHDRLTLPYVDVNEMCRAIAAPSLMITGWYDWGLNDALATWQLIKKEGRSAVQSQSRLIITPAAHNTPGFHEGVEEHPELSRSYRTEDNRGLLLKWHAAIRQGLLDNWPPVIYYLLGANQWRVSENWPPADARQIRLYLGVEGRLDTEFPVDNEASSRYVYDPEDPTPTVGGSILSSVYQPGSVDVSAVLCRTDVLSFRTAPLKNVVNVVGPLRLILYASSSAVDTDFCARISDVYPDGRTIQLQSGILRTRYRGSDPELLEPYCVYCLEIDMWATANQFKEGHRICLDICSADFPRFDRNTNRGGEVGSSVKAVQVIWFDRTRPSHLLISSLGDS